MDKDDDTHHSQSTDGETPKKSPPKQIRITNVAEFSPLTSPTGGRSVPNAADGDPSTAWTTGRFDNFPNFGNLGQRADGSGIVVDLGSVKKISRVEVQMYAGQTVEVLAAAPSASSPASLQDFPQRMSKLKDEGKRLRVNLNKPVKTRYVLVHITKLPPEGPNSYRGGIYEIKVFG
ncbi:hypothetical protein GCM10020221_23040 [Streptomyces thioluteus]|uniref:F5/8 type C domain-containing protein n=1 Tax=Streptomyces thioluteus TaxID=66431 RepID=A0ABP6JB41_STRTU